MSIIYVKVSHLAFKASRMIILAAHDKFRGRSFAVFGRDRLMTTATTRRKPQVIIALAINVLLRIAQHGLVVAGEIHAAHFAVEAARVEERIEGANDFGADFLIADPTFQGTAVSLLLID